MKQYINLLVFVLVAIAIYTAYGIFTFQKDEPQKFVFNEPKLPPELIAQDDAPQRPDEAKQQKQAVEDAQTALTNYHDIMTKLPQQPKDTLSVLIDRMTTSDLPLYFLGAADPQKGNLRSFETLKIDTDSVIDASQKKQNLNCMAKMPVAKILIGSAGKDIMACDASRSLVGPARDPDYIFIGGPENDQITDATGNRIINGGTGDDDIRLGAGRSIIMLDASWGHDTVTVDCAGAVVSDREIPKDFPIPWIYKTMNFIVLGKSIDPKDVVWDKNVLKDKVTGDTLTVNENCFTVVPTAR